MPGDSPSPRPMLSSAALREALAASAGFWHDVRVVAETGSTNADLLAVAKTGAPEGVVLAADTQSAGRGRLGRRWVSPPGTSLSFSVLLRPVAVPAARRAWVPLLAGVAVAAAVRGEAAVDARTEVAQRRTGPRRQAGRHPGRAGRGRDRGRHRDQRDRRPGRPAGGRGHVAAARGRGQHRPGAAARCRARRSSGAGTSRGRTRQATRTGPGCARSICAGARPSGSRSGCRCPAGPR